MNYYWFWNFTLYTHVSSPPCISVQYQLNNYVQIQHKTQPIDLSQGACQRFWFRIRTKWESLLDLSKFVQSDKALIWNGFVSFYLVLVLLSVSDRTSDKLHGERLIITFLHHWGHIETLTKSLSVASSGHLVHSK